MKRKIAMDGGPVFWGLLIVSAIVFPYLVLGTGSYVQVHDQMDGEILNYIYQARYLGESGNIKEFLNGASKASMIPPAFAGILFYKLFSPFAAFVAMQWFVLVCGFLGMYFLQREMAICRLPALAASVLFCYIPFYPTYGLAALGQPMVILAVIFLLRGEKRCLAFGLLILYGINSSLTLIGYAWLILGAVFCLLLFLTGRLKQACNILQGLLLLTGIYILTNIDLLYSLFGSGGFVTHRTEMAVRPVDNLIQQFFSLFFVGGSYSNVYSYGIFAAALLLLTIAAFFRKKAVLVEYKPFASGIKRICLLLATLIIATALAALWSSRPVVSLRSMLGGMFLYFQADRIYWIFPFLWILVLAQILQLLYLAIKKAPKLYLKCILLIGACGLCGIQGYQEFRDGTLNKNIRFLLTDDYKQVTWESFYMEDVFDEIDACIGTDKEKYSVVSLGMYPSIPLYHGYICADGYSNNYDIQYKHQFMTWQGEEDEKNLSAKALISDWGNRLYMISGAYGISPMISKDSGIVYEDIAWDIPKMKAANIGYIFAAAEITNAKELGLELVEGAPFESAASYYEIWLYHIK